MSGIWSDAVEKSVATRRDLDAKAGGNSGRCEQGQFSGLTGKVDLRVISHGASVKKANEATSY